MRRYRYRPRRGGNGALLLTGILILAVAAGYAGTKYVIAPYLLEGKLWDLRQENRQEEDVEQPSGTSGSGIVSGQQEVKDAKELTTGAAVTGAVTGTSVTTAPVINPPETAGGADQGTQAPAADAAAASAPAQQGGFAVQFGSFSTKEAADKAVLELSTKNISASVLEKNGAYKVIGSPFTTKEQAKAEADRLRPLAGDAFVTAL